MRQRECCAVYSSVKKTAPAQHALTGHALSDTLSLSRGREVGPFSHFQFSWSGPPPGRYPHSPSDCGTKLNRFLVTRTLAYSLQTGSEPDFGCTLHSLPNLSKQGAAARFQRSQKVSLQVETLLSALGWGGVVLRGLLSGLWGEFLGDGLVPSSLG